jgi:serine/threonine-protein kinase HipA
MNPMRTAKVMFKNSFAGIIEETENGYRFTYDSSFLDHGKPIAVAFPLQEKPFESEGLFPFFQGLLPEGWYRDIVCRTLKIDKDDLFGLLIRACKDCIGAVWVEEA